MSLFYQEIYRNSMKIFIHLYLAIFGYKVMPLAIFIREVSQNRANEAFLTQILFVIKSRCVI